MGFEKITKHLLEDMKPSLYFNHISREEWFQRETPYYFLYQLKQAKQSTKYHPEGDAWNHTMLVIDEAAKVRDKSKKQLVFMWAALLHDIGKPETTKIRKGRITSYDHDIIGAKRSEEFLDCFQVEAGIKKEISSLVRYHMHMLYILKNLPYGNKEEMKRNVDIEELALLCYCDRMGRGGADRTNELESYHQFIEMVNYMH